MPRERIYTDGGYLEVQWARDGQLVCIVSGSGDVEVMHQFTDSDDLGPLAAVLRRADRQAFVPCVRAAGMHCQRHDVDHWRRTVPVPD